MVDPGTALAAVTRAEKAIGLGKRAYNAIEKQSSYGAMRQAVEEHEALDAEAAMFVHFAEIAAPIFAEVLKVNGWPEGTGPNEYDRGAALADLLHAARRAGGARKRKVLEYAFFRRFDQDLYDQGRSKMLWDIVVLLEYPTLRALAMNVRDVNKQMEKSAERYSDAIRFAYPYKPFNEEWPYIRILQDRGLVFEVRDTGQTRYGPTQLGRDLVEMAWCDAFEATEERTE